MITEHNKLFVFAIAACFSVVQCCDKQTFEYTRINATKAPHLDEEVIPVYDVTGCITPIGEMEQAYMMQIRGQNVPVLYQGAVQNMPILDTIKFESDGITEVHPGAFENLPKLRRIDLAYNRIQEILEGVFNGLHIEIVILKNNNIKYIDPRAFDYMPNLINVELDNNRLQQWNSDWFANSPKILRLSVNHNEISQLPPRAFQNLRSLHEYDPNHPYVDVILANNKISRLDADVFRGIQDFGVLDLGENDISYIDDNTFRYLTNIDYLMLGDNQLTCFSDNVLDSLINTGVISINGNPWDCNCLKNMREWSRLYRKNLVYHKTELEWCT